MSALRSGWFKLYCYILKESESSFHVDIPEGATVSELKEAILIKNGNTLVGVDGHRLKIWKHYMSTKDLMTELTKLRLRDENALDGAVLLSSKFSDASLGQIHVIVKAPDDNRPSKKPRLDSGVSDDDNAMWELLWHTFWGKSAAECFVKVSAHIPSPRSLQMPTEETNYEYLKLPDAALFDAAFFPCGLRRILITDTYKSLYAKLCDEDELYREMLESERLSSLTHSTIITGQPGIGKTAGLSCILVWRLQEKKPTVYCDNDTRAFVFTNTGFEQVSLLNNNRIKQLDKSIDCCALVDIAPQLPVVPSHFRPFITRQGRVVVATSPNPNHVTLFNQHHAMTYYTPTWKWADLYCAGLIQFPSVAPEKLRDAYTKLRGIPRRCFRALKSDGEVFEIRTIKKAINDIENIDKFAESANGPLPFDTEVTHALVRMEPVDDTWTNQTTELLSDYVADLLFERIDHHNTLKICNSIDFLLRNPNTRGWGGKLFERAVHHIFRKGIEFDTVPMDDEAPSLRVQIKKADSEAGGYFQTLSVRARKGSQKVGDEFLNQYLIPLSSTAETIDAASISKDVTVLFQMTVSPSHSLNLKGITELIDELPASAKKLVCIVFIVPDHETCPKPYKRQNIDIPLGVSKDVSDPVVGYKQYVYYCPLNEL